jgi:hypothetical protein
VSLVHKSPAHDVRRYRLHEEHEKVFWETQSVCAAEFNLQINAPWAKERDPASRWRWWP